MSKTGKVDGGAAAGGVKPLRSRLGRGLSSLISVSELPVSAAVAPPAVATAVVASGGVTEIPVAEIAPNPHQPRRQMNEAGIAELAASIKSTGLIQPVIVRQEAGGYELIAGERRLRAAKLAGMTRLPAIIRDVDGFTQAQMALIENIQREDLNPLDRAASYQALIDQLGLTQAELAMRLGEDRSSIANHVRLLGLEDSVRERVRDGSLTLGHAKLLAGITDAVEQIKVASLVVAQQLSVRNLERILQESPTAPTTRSQPANAAHMAALERTLTHQLGLRVEVRSGSKKGRGRVVIHYTNLSEFDDLMGRLGVKID